MNTLKTFLLLAAMTALFGIIGHAVGGPQGAMVALIMAAAMNIFSWWRSDKMVLAMYRAQPLESGAVVDMVHELAHAAGLPNPRVYIIDNAQPNAFATGRDPYHAAVAVTSGIVQILSPREMRGVIAHELAHIKNRDTLTMTITATLAGALSSLAHIGMFMGHRNGGGNQNNGGQALLLMILAPLAATIVQMAISRTREYEADRIGGEICGDPQSLAHALLKLQSGASRIPNDTAEHNPATAHMFIVNPLSHMKNFQSIFRTHPETEKRVAALMLQAKAMDVSGTDFTPNNPWD